MNRSGIFRPPPVEVGEEGVGQSEGLQSAEELTNARQKENARS